MNFLTIFQDLKLNFVLNYSIHAPKSSLHRVCACRPASADSGCYRVSAEYPACCSAEKSFLGPNCGETGRLRAGNWVTMDELLNKGAASEVGDTGGEGAVVTSAVLADSIDTSGVLNGS